MSQRKNNMEVEDIIAHLENTLFSDIPFPTQEDRKFPSDLENQIRRAIEKEGFTTLVEEVKDEEGKVTDTLIKRCSLSTSWESGSEFYTQHVEWVDNTTIAVVTFLNGNLLQRWEGAMIGLRYSYFYHLNKSRKQRLPVLEGNGVWDIGERSIQNRKRPELNNGRNQEVWDMIRKDLKMLNS